MSTNFSTRKSVLYGAIVTVSLLVFFELIARVAEFAREPSELVRKIEAQKQIDSFRIFVYGGSTAEGQPTLTSQKICIRQSKIGLMLGQTTISRAFATTLVWEVTMNGGCVRTMMVNPHRMRL